MEFMTAACSDVGIRKKVNEDSYCIKIAETEDEKILLAVVCDGMGGLARGELASATVIRAFSKWFEDELPNEINNFRPENIKSRWNSIIQEQNNKIGGYGREAGVMLGTTLTAFLIIKEYIIIAHVGDSRLYEINETLRVVTEDQTVVQRDLRNGRITKEQALVDPRRNVLLQCVGASKSLQPEFIIEKVKNNCTYMLCSDGFRHIISENEIFLNLKPDVLNDEDIMKYNAEALVELNKQRKETDNITVVIVKTY